MNKNVQFLIMFFMISFSLQSSDRPSNQCNRSLTLAESAFVGGFAGVGEVATSGQPLSYVMNMAIRNAAIKDPKIPKEKFIFLQSYKGFLAHAGGQMPIVAIQNVVKEKGSQCLQSRKNQTLSDFQKATVSFVAGFCGAIIDTPSNAIQLFLQDPAHKGKSFAQACKELGIKKSFRGFGPNSILKEGPFVVGYQFLSLKGEEIAKKNIEDTLIAKLVGSIGAGVFTAVITQPGAVMRNTMQSDARYVTTSAVQTAQKIYAQEGYQGFFKGLPARGLRIAIAIPLLSDYTKRLENCMKENR